MAPNSMSLRKLPSPITPIVVESIVVEPDHQQMAESMPHVSNKTIREKQQIQACDTTVDLIDICDDDDNDHATEINSATAPDPNPVTSVIEKKGSCLSPTPAAAATSIFVADPDPKIELGLSVAPRPHLEIVEQPASNSLRFR